MQLAPTLCCALNMLQNFTKLACITGGAVVGVVQLVNQCAVCYACRCRAVAVAETNYTALHVLVAGQLYWAHTRGARSQKDYRRLNAVGVARRTM